MREIKVIFTNGESLVTNINGTNEEILDYYLGADRLGKLFNIGMGEKDYFVTTRSVEFLN